MKELLAGPMAALLLTACSGEGSRRTITVRREPLTSPSPCGLSGVERVRLTLTTTLDQWCAGHRTPLREAAPTDWIPFRSGRSGRAQYVARTIIALVESALRPARFEIPFREALRGLSDLGVPLGEIDRALRAAHASRS